MYLYMCVHVYDIHKCVFGNNNLKDYGSRKTREEFRVSRDVENNVVSYTHG